MLKDVCIGRAQRSHETSQPVVVFRCGNRDPRPGAGSEGDGKPLSQGHESAGQQVFKGRCFVYIRGGEGGGPCSPALSRVGLMASPLELGDGRARRALE